MKWGSHQYGDLAPCEAYTALWQAIVVDCTGPWVIELGKEINFLALTSINTSPNLLVPHHKNITRVCKSI